MTSENIDTSVSDRLEKNAPSGTPTFQNDFAGFWIRFLAWVIDALLLLVPGSLLMAVGFSPLGSFLLGFFYKPFFESSQIQATIGKRILGIKVVGNNGNRISFKSAVVRWAISTLSTIFACLGHIIQPFTKHRQSLADIIAETYVIEGREEIGNGHNLLDCWVDQVKEVFRK